MYDQIAANKRHSWLLIIIFVAVIAVLGWFIGYASGYGNGIIIIAGIFAVIMSLFSFYGGDKVALSISGAQPITKEQAPYVYRMVENLCIASGQKVPDVYLIDSQAINAFATGRDPEHSSIAITTGAVAKLENEELEGVIAHELSHIRNYDIRLMMIVIILVGFISILADFFLHSSIIGGRRSRDGEGGNILAIVGIVLVILSPIIAQLIKLAVSRRREYLADASGALLTRYPDGLASALEKIKNDGSRLETASTATAHLYISNPFGGSGKFIAGLFSTHPPIDERISRLRSMAR